MTEDLKNKDRKIKEEMKTYIDKLTKKFGLIKTGKGTYKSTKPLCCKSM